MRILRLSSYCYPEKVASSHLTEDLFEQYRQHGIEAVIYAPTPTRGIDEETRKKYKKIRYEERYDGAVKIHRFPLFREGRHPLLRAFRYFICILEQTWCGLRAKDCDVLFISSTPPINGLMIAVLHRFKKYKIVYNLQDVFPDSLVSTGMTHQGSLLWRIGRVIEKITYRSADRISVISEDIKENILAKGVPESKIAVVPNWVDETQVVHIPRADNPLFDTYGLDRDKFIVCYGGNIGHAQNLDLLARVALTLSDHPEIVFVVMGDGPRKSQLAAYVQENHLTNFILLPYQDPSLVSCVFSLGDVSMVMCKPGSGKGCMPSKTWNIMSSSTPVLASFDEDSELCRILQQNRCGVCVAPDDETALREAILSLAADRMACAEMGKNGRTYIETVLTKERCTGLHLALLHDVTGK